MAGLGRSAGRKMTVGEFLAYDDGTPSRYELVGGELVAMNPPATRHVQICSNIAGALEAQLKPPCRVYSQSPGVARSEAGDTWREPDVLVTCVRPARGFFLEPRLIVEVLSPSTEKEDRTTKLDFYEGLPSVQAVLLVWQDERRVRLRERGDGWHDQDMIGSGTVRTLPLGVALTLDEIYVDPWPEPESPSSAS